MMHMQRSASKMFALALLAFGAIGCAEEGVGDPCIPEAIPYDKTKAGTASGGYGFAASETYLETSSVQCRTRICIVRKLDNGTSNAVPADPRGHTCSKPRNAGNTTGCVTNEALNKSIYCTCKCAGPETSELCQCPDGFSCKNVEGLDRGGAGIQGSYCLRSGST
jgi:hypothetical protein